MGRVLLGLLAGLVAGMVLIALLQAATVMIFMPSLGEMAQRGEMPQIPTGMLIIFMIYDIGGAVLAAWLATLVAKDRGWATVVALAIVILLTRVIYNFAYTDHPAPVFGWISAVLMPLAALVAGRPFASYFARAEEEEATAPEPGGIATQATAAGEAAEESERR
jgi:hypothetical protein